MEISTSQTTFTNLLRNLIHQPTIPPHQQLEKFTANIRCPWIRCHLNRWFRRHHLIRWWCASNLLRPFIRLRNHSNHNLCSSPTAVRAGHVTATISTKCHRIWTFNSCRLLKVFNRCSLFCYFCVHFTLLWGEWETSRAAWHKLMGLFSPLLIPTNVKVMKIIFFLSRKFV